MERFAQFVSQLLLSAATEVMPDTANTPATVCAGLGEKSVVELCKNVSAHQVILLLPPGFIRQK